MIFAHPSNPDCPPDCTTSRLIAVGRLRLPARRRRHVLGRRAAAGLVAVGVALLLAAGAAQAQTTVKLVGTTGQAENTSSTQSRFINDRAQAFTTGSNLTGYTLKQVDLPMSYNGHTSPTAPAYTVTIHDATSSGPGSTVLGTLTNPASVADGNNSYTTTGIALAANTTYFVVIDVTGTGGNHHRISNDITDSDNEDLGAAAGWSIADNSFSRQFEASSWVSRGFSWKMAIRGVVIPLAPPAAPATPTLSGTDGTSLTVTWTAPSGSPDDYDVRYRRKGDRAWTDHAHEGTALTTTITGLVQGMSWEAQVAASNAVGPGQWSATGAGHTGPARFVKAETNAGGGGVFVTFTKNLLSGTPPAGSHFTVDRNGTDVTPGGAFLDGPNQERLALNIFSNPVQAGETVTVSYAPSGSFTKLFDADAEEIASFSNKPVTNLVPAAPAAPAAPTVSSVSGQGALSVSWTAPADNKGAITDYDLRYFAGSADPTDDNDWIEAGDTGGQDHVGAATSATVTGLSGGTTYRVQVRAENSAGEGAWSPSGSGTTASSVPDAPAAPTVSPVASLTNLSVSWTAPGTGGSAITGYDLRYYAGTADPDDEADWVRENEASGIPTLSANTATMATISGLQASTAYRVQVRAQNGTGWGAWSSSGSATTNAASGTNNAPTRMMLGTSNNCVVKTANTAFRTINVPAGTLVSVSPILGGTCSGANRQAPMFGDQDGDTLTVTARVRNLPDNVRFYDNTPKVLLTEGTRVFIDAIAAYRLTDVTIDVTATDPHGASVSTFIVASVGTFGSTGPPTFESQAENLQYALNDAIEPVVLPAATGGNTNGGDFPYTYEVEGLPPGLAFDDKTRTLSGTPTKAGLFIVTYKAGDADNAQGGGDKAEQTFRIGVGIGLRITQVRIVSRPTYDSDGDGTADTYVEGDKILIDVEFNGPVKVSGTRSEVTLRLDLGTDGGTLRDSQKVLTLNSDSERHGSETLRFTYTVVAADSDTDGVWVQKDANGNNKVLFIRVGSDATITHAVTGETADPTYRGLGTTGDPLHKVDGSRDSDDIGPKPSSTTAPTVNGDTLTVTFDTNLAAPADLDALRYHFFVRGAGGVGDDDKNATQSPQAIVHGTGADADELTLTLGAPARAGDTVTLTYTGKTLKGAGASGKRAPMFRGLAVTNNTPGAKGPALLNASLTGTKLKLLFDADLDTGSRPSGSAFLVETYDLDRTPRDIAGTGTVSIEDAVVTVTLASGLRADEETASVSYEKPSSSPLRSAGSGNPEVQSFDRFRIAALSDGVPPKLLGAVAQSIVGGSEAAVALYFDEALDTSSEPATGDFTLRKGESAVSVRSVLVEDRTVTLFFDAAAPAGTVFEVTWTPGTHRIRDLAGNAAAGFRQTVTAGPTGKPVLQSAVATGARVTLTYDKPLIPGDTPPADAFTLHLPLFSGERVVFQHDVVAVAVAGRTVVLQLEDVVYPCAGDTPITVSYTKPSLTAPLRSFDGTEADALTHEDVTNGHTYRCNNYNWLEGARVGSVILRAQRPLATDVAPEASWFTVTASGGPVTVTAAAYSADDAQELKLSLSRDLEPGETVTVSYIRPRGEYGLWDTDGKQLGDIVDMPVTNPAVATALTAAFNDVPAGHEGQGSEFSFELAFSENFGGRLDYKVLRDEALQATNARVTGAARVTQGQNQRWTITVRPRSNDDVTVTLPATEDCSAAGAICVDGRKLSNTTSATVAFEAGDMAPAGFKSAATAESGRGLILTFTKDIETAGVHTNYTVMVDGESRDTSSSSWEDDTVGLLLAEPVQWGETVTVAYTQPTDGVALRDADDLAIESFGPEAVTNMVPQPAETSPATGAPTIAGTAQAGETLTASTDGIADADGLTGATFAFQWVSNDGSDTDISGATGSSYALTDADVGATIKVRASFTDDAGNGEELTSAATAAVQARPLTAEFQGMPAEHDGRKLFSFELVFSENFPGRLDYKTLRDSAFTVTNGRVRGAERVVKSENRRWKITVRPSSNDDVTIVLPAGSVSTESGRPLSAAVSGQVTGPVGVSVADAKVKEGAGAVLAFAVTLSRAATSAFTVDYATSDGTAQAGADYTAASGTLSFQAGDSSKTIEVSVLDDAHDEGEETLTLTLSNASGAWLADGEATGTIENADLMPAALLARFSRATAEQVVTTIEERMAAPRERGFRARFAGRELQSGQERDFALGLLSQFAQPMGMGPAGAGPMAMGSSPAGAGTAGMGCSMGTGGAPGMTAVAGAMGGGASMTMGPRAAGALGAGAGGMGCAMGAAGMGGMGGAMGMGGMGMPGQQASMAGYGSMDAAHGGGLFDSMGMGGDLLSNSEFELNRESRGGILSVWSRSSRSHFTGMEDALSLNGDVRTTMFGADWARGALTLGLSVGRTLGLGGYSGASGGQMTTSMTGFYPWVGYQVSERVSVWGVTGYGTGSLSLTPNGQSALETGVSMMMSAVGTRGELIGSRATGGFALAFKADALYVTAASDLLDGAAGRLNASEAGVTRVRTALEGSRGFTLGGGRLSLRPSVEVGLRRDGGDAETGAGMDVGGGLAFTDTVTGLSLDVRVRTLVVHQAEGFTDRGMSLSLGWDPTPSSPLGLTARVAPSWGGQAQGGAEALWGNQMAYGMGSHQVHGAGGQLNAEVGYGLPVGARFVGTPRIGLRTSQYGRDYQFGYGLGVLEQGRMQFELGVEAQRRESPMEGGASNGLMGRATLGW